MSFAESFDLGTEIVELTPFVPADQPVGDHMPLRELAFRADAWLPRETEALRTAFLADQALEDIATTLGRSRASIATRIGDLGLRRHSTRAWSEWDDAELAQRYAAEPTATIAAHLGRSVSAVYARASCLGLTEPPPQPYSGWEDAQIRVGYTHGVPVVQIAGLIGRPVMGVVCRAGHLGLRHACQPSDWSEAELARAMELASEGMRYVVIAGKLAEEGFPSRNSRSLGQRLRKFGYGRGWGRAWIAEEDDLLRRAYATGASLTPLRERLGRSVSSIRWRVGELGLRGTHERRDGFRQGPVWSEEDNERLRRDYGRLPSREIAAALGRGLRAMLIHAHSLGLVHGFIRPFGADEDQAIRNAWTHGVSMTDVAAALVRDTAVISKHAIRLGYGFSDPARPYKATRQRRAGRQAVTLASLLALSDAPVPCASTTLAA